MKPDFFKARGVKLVIFDIDDTLLSHTLPVPDDALRSFLRSFADAGLSLALISNNRKERVDRFNKELQLFAVARAKKPKKSALAPFFAHFGVQPHETALVGDQIFTDVRLARKCGVLAVLVEPIDPYETGFFYIKRALEKPILRAYFKRKEKKSA